MYKRVIELSYSAVAKVAVEIATVAKLPARGAQLLLVMVVVGMETGGACVRDRV